VNRVLDLFRYGWIHLHPVIVKEDSISRQSSIRSIQIYLPIHIDSLFSLHVQVEAVQLPHFLSLWLVIMVYPPLCLQSLAGHHFSEADLQLPHHLFLRLSIMESDSDFNRELPSDSDQRGLTLYND
jgi:hypothetical protein